MITDVFDDRSHAIINPCRKENAPEVDACIMTFSYMIEEFVLANYECEQIASFWSATGNTPIYGINYKGKKFAFFKTYVGAPACVATVEDTLSELQTDKYIVFGGAGCLNKEIAPASDYITVKNADVVAGFMQENGIPYIKGKTWTTDAFYRETMNNFKKRRADGCISVEMECAALQAMCDFKELNLYTFFTSGDLLDAPEWDTRRKEGETKGTQHDTGHFDIALELARYVVE